MFIQKSRTEGGKKEISLGAWIRSHDGDISSWFHIVLIITFALLFTRKLPSYKNQSIDLLCKSIDWFLYDRNFGVLRLFYCHLLVISAKIYLFGVENRNTKKRCKNIFKVNNKDIDVVLRSLLLTLNKFST